ncbi:unnamed protein product [Kuraishia capsulata CBS 1993]|uniref:Uncharacterized protein n=1 Tax=Kuraishia capsulata CBS 1993 TaxID=1382522 RepID=W6MG79_9ASCO|nr:uncharacterized protein KUCA_T00000441001 [Kuraishia capsulata CBS 1993]CDK24478.1 unnamed protein product [Kuraishia capsulata CBS 1993]
MGICLSCLYPVEEEYNEETSPLLPSQVDDSEDTVRRNKELETIVTNTNELLIDITSFLNSSNGDGRDVSISSSGLLNAGGKLPVSRAADVGETNIYNPQSVSQEQRRSLEKIHAKAKSLVMESVAINSSNVGALIADFS